MRIAGAPEPSSGACSPYPNGSASETSCVSAAGRRGALPVSLAMRRVAVSTSAGGGERPSSPASSRRGRAVPARPSSETTATARRASGERAAKRAAPSAPYAPPSVDRKTSVWRGVRADSVVPTVA